MAKAIQNKEFEMFRVKEYIKKSEDIQLGLWGYLAAALYMRWRTLEIARIKTNKNEEES